MNIPCSAGDRHFFADVVILPSRRLPAIYPARREGCWRSVARLCVLDVGCGVLSVRLKFLPLLKVNAAPVPHTFPFRRRCVEERRYGRNIWFAAGYAFAVIFGTGCS